MRFSIIEKERLPQTGLALLLALSTVLVYLPGLMNDFVVWDDEVNVIDNLHIRSLDWTFLKWAFTDLSTGTYWHPIVWISYAVDYAIWGLNPMGYHLTALLWHTLNTVLAFFLAGQLIGSAKTQPLPGTYHPGGWDRDVLIAAVVTGALFGLHPIHVESVAWASERKDLLYSFFFILSVMAYLNHAGFRTASEADSGQLIFSFSRWYLLSLFFFMLSLASKPMAVTLPVVFILLDWYPLRRIESTRSFSKALLGKSPFIAISLMIGIWTLAAQKAASTMPSLDAVPLLTRVLVACKALIMYLWNIVLPVNLLPLYPYPRNVSFSAEYVFFVIVSIGITASCIFAARKQKLYLAVWVYYVISLLPVLGLIQVGYHYMADRFMYLAGIGPFLLAGLGMAKILSKRGSLSQATNAVNGVVIAGAVILCIVLSGLTLRQVAVWKDSITLWSHVIEKEPSGASLAFNNRGIAYGEMGQSELALRDFDAALSLDPASSYSYNNRGKILLEMGQPDQALADFNAAIAQDEGYAMAYHNRGNVYRAKGKADKALENYTKAVLLNPGFAEAFVRRGIVYGEAGSLEKSIGDFSMAIIANPYYPDAYIARGLSYEQSGQFDRAIEDLDKAISLAPNNVDAYLNRGVALVRAGRHERAIEDYDKAITLSPEDFLLYWNRGIAFRELMRFDAAIADYTKALSLNPDFAQGYVDRGNLYLKKGRPERALRDYQQACYLGSRPGCEAMQATSSAGARH